MSVFYVTQGWLRYRPFDTYELPRLERIDDDAVFERQETDSAHFAPFTIPRYRLVWPGQVREVVEGRVRKKGVDERISDLILAHWPGSPTRLGRHIDGHSRDLESLVEHGNLPDEPPEVVAYHRAVNRRRGFGPVAGLPARRVGRVLDATFAIDAETLATLRYLAWHAESHWMHPILRSGDTSRREQLAGLAQESAWLFFNVLADCQYDPETRWWDRREGRWYWGSLATYLHWVGRTGSGTYEGLARFGDREKLGVIMPDVADRLRAWLVKAEEQSRYMGHVDGRTDMLAASSGPSLPA